MSNRSILVRGAKAAGKVALVLLLSLSGLASARADVTPQSVNGFQHFADCLHALLTDAAEHQKYCGPGLALPGSSLSSGGGGKSTNCPLGMIGPEGLSPDLRVLVAFSCLKCVSCTDGAENFSPMDLAVGDRVLVACCPA